MRELPHLIKDALTAGLRSDERIRRGEPACVELRNLKPSSQGAVSPEKLRYPITDPAFSQAWPYPQLRRFDTKLYFYDGAELRSVREILPPNNWAATLIELWQSGDPSTSATLAGGGGDLHVASFSNTFWLTDGTNIIFRTPGNTSNKTLVIPTDTLKCESLHSYDDRLFMAGVSGTQVGSPVFVVLFQLWKDLQSEDFFTGSDEGFDTNYVIYSEKHGGDTDSPFELFKRLLGVTTGSASADSNLDVILRTAIETGEIGFIPCRSTGLIRVLKSLDNALIAYGQSGVSVLAPDGSGNYIEAPLALNGVPGRGSIGGDETEHIIVNTDGDLWRLTNDGATRLGYKEFIASLTLADTIVSFDDEFREFWISDGTATYIFNRFGLGGPVSLLPSSLVRSFASATMLGTSPTIDYDVTVTPPTDLDPSNADIVLIRTTPTDFGQRGQKHVTSFHVASEGVRDGRATVHYRYDQTSATYTRRKQDKITQDGFARIDVNLVDAMIEVLGVAPTQEAEYDYIEVRYQTDDRRHIRGIQSQGS